jgi:hypothetical protein
MSVSLATMTVAELDDAFDSLSHSSAFLRTRGEYALAMKLKSRASEINQHLLRREADHRQMVARQLSLVPPGYGYEL